MNTEEVINTNNKLLQLNYKVLIVICIVLYFLAILQDYIFSKVKLTGFYWSDTMLYNIYWLLFIPFIQFANYVYHKIQLNTRKNKILYAFASAFVFSVLHIFLFTSIFILASNIIYPIPHRFSTIFKNAISNQSQITILVYLYVPFIFQYLNRKKQLKKEVSTQKYLTVKNGTRRIKVDISAILFIKTDRPYTAIFTDEQRLLHDENLKQLEKFLDPKTFIRVHRSVIINKNHITEIESRKNGDYDCILKNGQPVRLSRHYRKNWNELLNQ